jgi:hypothetical protein
MKRHSIADVPASVQPLRVIKPAALRHMLGGISRSTEHRRRQTDPDFPTYVPGLGYSEEQAVAYVRRKLAQGGVI